MGKSSLINRLANRKNLARASSTPGRTREIHFFNLEDTAYFIDLPGYGYAKVPLEMKKMWGPMMERFFKKIEGVRLVVMILDVRRTPNEDDFQMLNWLEANGHPYIFAITKADKVTRTKLRERLKELQTALQLEDDSALIPVSSLTGLGVEDLLGVVREVLAAPQEPEAGDPNEPSALQDQ